MGEDLQGRGPHTDRLRLCPGAGAASSARGGGGGILSMDRGPPPQKTAPLEGRPFHTLHGHVRAKEGVRRVLCRPPGPADVQEGWVCGHRSPGPPLCQLGPDSKAGHPSWRLQIRDTDRQSTHQGPGTRVHEITEDPSQGGSRTSVPSGDHVPQQAGCSDGQLRQQKHRLSLAEGPRPGREKRASLMGSPPAPPAWGTSNGCAQPPAPAARPASEGLGPHGLSVPSLVKMAWGGALGGLMCSQGHCSERPHGRVVWLWGGRGWAGCSNVPTPSLPERDPRTAVRSLCGWSRAQGGCRTELSSHRGVAGGAESLAALGSPGKQSPQRRP